MKVVAAVLGICGVFVLVFAWKPHATDGQVRMAEWQADAAGRYVIRREHEKMFRFDGRNDRVLVADTPEFHFGTNQDFSVEAWIKAYPTPSPSARKLQVWVQTHPGMTRFLPHWLGNWITTHAQDNDFGVMPIVSKSRTVSTIEATGFEFCLSNGHLGCQLAQQPMRQMAFQNFISASPTLQDVHWHYVAMTVNRTSLTGGKLYVDGKQVLVFDPTAQAGDLSNSEPLRIGNHANPNLRCFFKGAITGVALQPRVLSADQIFASYRVGR